MQQPSDAIQRAWVALIRAADALRDKVARALADAGAPSLEAYSVLWALERAGGRLRPRDLARELFLERYNVTRLVDALARGGLVRRERCPDDRRGHHVALTEAGKAERRRMWSVYGPAMAEAFAPLDDARAGALTGLLEPLAGASSREPCGGDQAEARSSAATGSRSPS
jgi:DNA-binding MarR family transcriptional regulator